MSWRSLRVSGGIDREAVLAVLFQAGSAGVQEDAQGLVTHFPETTDVNGLAARIREVAPAAAVEIGDTPDIDWSQAWKSGVRAHRIGALTVAPPWLATGTEDDPRGSPAGATDEETIVIDPGMAFGTGEHPTTRGVLALMQRVLRAGDRVADLGAGSAVLSIAAARLGAEWAVAIESDPDAISNAEANVARNRVGDRVRVLEGDAALVLPLIAPVRVVLANIISSVLRELLPVIAGALEHDGEAILSGILVTEREAMLDALQAAWQVRYELEDQGWWSVTIGRR